MMLGLAVWYLVECPALEYGGVRQRQTKPLKPRNEIP